MGKDFKWWSENKELMADMKKQLYEFCHEHKLRLN